MYCKHCGQLIDDDSTFCRFCGMPQNSIASNEPSKDEIIENVVDNETTDEIEDATENDSSTNKPNPTIEVIVKKPQKPNVENKARNVIKLILKEIAIILLCGGIAYLGKLVAYKIEYNSNPIPEVSAQDQKAFNDSIFHKQYPNGTPSYEELEANNWQWDEEKYPRVDVFAFGLYTSYIKLGEFKYDSKIFDLSQMEDITTTRQELLKSYSEEVSEYAFWIILITLPSLRYLILFVRWLVKGNI